MTRTPEPKTLVAYERYLAQKHSYWYIQGLEGSSSEVREWLADPDEDDMPGGHMPILASQFNESGEIISTEASEQFDAWKLGCIAGQEKPIKSIAYEGLVLVIADNAPGS